MHLAYTGALNSRIKGRAGGPSAGRGWYRRPNSGEGSTVSSTLGRQGSRRRESAGRAKRGARAAMCARTQGGCMAGLGWLMRGIKIGGAGRRARPRRTAQGFDGGGGRAGSLAASGRQPPLGAAARQPGGCGGLTGEQPRAAHGRATWDGHGPQHGVKPRAHSSPSSQVALRRRRLAGGCPTNLFLMSISSLPRLANRRLRGGQGRTQRGGGGGRASRGPFQPR